MGLSLAGYYFLLNSTYNWGECNINLYIKEKVFCVKRLPNSNTRHIGSILSYVQLV